MQSPTAPAVAGIHRRTRFEVTEALAARFWLKVDKRSASECWNWLGANRNGYGAIKHNTAVLSAHVVAAAINLGEVPEGMIVLHSCDNRLCCNPSHIRYGTPTENVREMQERRKIRAHRGTESPNATITESQVTAAKAMRMVWGIGATRAAKVLGVTQTPIDNALAGTSWRHVGEPTREQAERICQEILASKGITLEQALQRNRRGEGRYTKPARTVSTEASQ